MVNSIVEVVTLITSIVALAGVLLNGISSKMYAIGFEKDFETNISRASRSLFEYIGYLLYSVFILICIILFISIFSANDTKKSNNTKFSNEDIITIMKNNEESKKIKKNLNRSVDESVSLDFIEKISLKNRIETYFSEYNNKNDKKNVKDFNTIVEEVNKNKKTDPLPAIILFSALVFIMIFLYYIYRDVRKRDYTSSSYIIIEDNQKIAESDNKKNKLYIIKRFSNDIVILKDKNNLYQLKTKEQLTGTTIYMESSNMIAQRRYKNYINLVNSCFLGKSIIKIKLIKLISWALFFISLLSMMGLFFWNNNKLLTYVFTISTGFFIPTSYVAFQYKRGMESKKKKSKKKKKNDYI